MWKVFEKNSLFFITLSLVLLLSTTTCLGAETDYDKQKVKTTDTQVSPMQINKQHQNKRGLSEYDASLGPDPYYNPQTAYGATAGGYSQIAATPFTAPGAVTLPIYSAAPVQAYSKPAFMPFTSGFKLPSNYINPSTVSTGISAYQFPKIGYANLNYPQVAYASHQLPAYYSTGYQNLASYYPSTALASHLYSNGYPSSDTASIHAQPTIGFVRSSHLGQAVQPVYSSSSFAKFPSSASNFYPQNDFAHIYAAPQYASYQVQTAAPFVTGAKQYAPNVATNPDNSQSKPGLTSPVAAGGAVSYASFAQHNSQVQVKSPLSQVSAPVNSPVNAPHYAFVSGAYKVSPGSSSIYAQIPSYGAASGSLQYGTHLYPSVPKLGLIQTTHQ